MRTGAEYRAALRDGRKVWVVGEGRIEDVATHPATRAMVDVYAAWYDRHADPEWHARLFSPSGTPWAFTVPKAADDLVGMGRCFCATTLPTAGNVTHTPAYGHMIALGVQSAVQDAHHSERQVADAMAYRALIAETGRFLTFSSGGAPVGFRMRADPAARTALRIVRERDDGLVIRGKAGMHTSPAFAEDVYIGALCGTDYQGLRATFVVAVNAPGVTVVCRKISARHSDPSIAPLTGRFDELDGQLWLDDVFIPWERVFLTELSPEPVARWLFWHQLYCWLAKAEFTLGLALACTHAMGLVGHPQTVEYLLDLMTDVQTVRACQVAAERDPWFTNAGDCYPNHLHVAAGAMAMLKARQRMSEILRILPGSSLVLSPGASDLAAPEMAEGFEESLTGGGYTAAQRAALLNLAWDHVSSTLDARESAFELHANGGMQSWRARLRRGFDRYEELANAVLATLDMKMPEIDLGPIRTAGMPVRRPVEVKS